MRIFGGIFLVNFEYFCWNFFGGGEDFWECRGGFLRHVSGTYFFEGGISAEFLRHFPGIFLRTLRNFSLIFWGRFFLHFLLLIFR